MSKAAACAAGLIFVLMTLACGGHQDELSGTSWSLILLGPAGFPEPVLFGVGVTAKFSENGNEISGSGGCNSYSGSYKADETSFNAEALSWTERGCLEPAGVMEQEERFLRLLSSAEAFAIGGLRLTVTGAGDQVLIFLRTEE